MNTHHIAYPARWLRGRLYCAVEVNGLAINPPQPLSLSPYYVPCCVRLAQCSTQRTAVSVQQRCMCDDMTL